jgi:RND family efflux transporter MFP subunit
MKRARGIPGILCRRRRAARAAAAAILVALAGLAGCERRQAPPPPAVPTVTVAHPVARLVKEWDQYTGRLDAVDSVEVRARVSGMVTAAPFKEGDLVQAGDLLFEIDARPFQADLDNKLAAVARAEAQVTLARITLKRVGELHAVQAATNDELDTAAANLATAVATVAAAKADVDASRLNVEWCRVTAPITGKISRKFITPGNLINGGPGQAALLTTILSLDPIYCYFEVDEHSILKYLDLARTHQLDSRPDRQLPCLLQLADEPGFPHVGRLDFKDNRTDPGTGTTLLRALVPNPGGWMAPGFFARVRVPGSARYQTLLVPDAAIGIDQNQKSLLVVGPDGTVAAKPVLLGVLFGTLRSIPPQGNTLTADDLVVVNGLMQARPGSKVKTQLVPTAPESLPAEDPPASASAN